MKLSTVLSALAGFAATAHAGCFSGGENWGDNKQAVYDMAHRMCHLNFQGNFEGNYGPAGTPGGHRALCRNLNGKKMEFQIWHVKGGDRWLSADECYSGLSSEIRNCNHGGDTTYTNWRYK